MASIGLVTDSTADLSPAAQERLGLTVVPLVVNWDGQSYRDKTDMSAAELCILVAGGTDVDLADAQVTLNGRDAVLRKTTSAGQFAAATDDRPENWTWFIAPIARGPNAFRIELALPLEDVSVGIYIRGFTTATNDPAPELGNVFPTHNPERRAWSETLQPLVPLQPPAR